MTGSSNASQEHETITSKLESAFVSLLEAIDYAEDTHSDRWEFAVAIRHLQSLGLNDNDLRWLVRKGYVEHAREVTVQGVNGREFQPIGDLTFCNRTCVVLTEAGVSKARSVIESQEKSQDDANCHSETNSQPERTPVPHWNADIRELRLDGKVVKRFKWHAVNQEIVLNVFQEEGWPFRIDDPLPPHPEQDPKRRLSDTIKCLNRKQTNELVHFHGDGTGEGVTWERVAAERSNVDQK
jgi:hypothetical protein